MGMSPFVWMIALLAAAPPLAVAQIALPETALADEQFQMLLRSGGITELRQACGEAASFGMDTRRQLLRDRLMTLHPRPQSLDVVLANAEALLACNAPDSARTVLGRFIPGKDADRRRWLLLSWQAADAALDHQQAALALRRLVDGDLVALEAERLVAAGAGPFPVEPRILNGLDQLALHEAAAGHPLTAAAVLLSGRATGVVAARRLGMAADLLAAADADQADQLLELALDQAADQQAWGLAVELLRLQLRLQLAAGGDGARPQERLERLTLRLDDRYASWRRDGGQASDPMLRSPREPGGHAAVEDSQVEPAP